MKKLCIFLTSFLMLAGISFAQEDYKTQMFSIHEDVVKPSMTGQYMEVMKKFKDAIIENGESITWATVRYEDNTFVHVMPIENFAALDKDIFAGLAEKMGPENFGILMSGFGECYDDHRDFVVALDPSLSYKPEMEPADGENYRDIFFWYPMPSKTEEAKEIIIEWKNLYASKNIETPWATYRMLFGSEMPMYAIVSWGKNAAEMATREMEHQELFGEAATKLNEKAMAITNRMEIKRGMFLPDISNMPPADAGSN